jgi:hypothetical protein
MVFLGFPEVEFWTMSFVPETSRLFYSVLKFFTFAYFRSARSAYSTIEVSTGRFMQLAG